MNPDFFGWFSVLLSGLSKVSPRGGTPWPLLFHGGELTRLDVRVRTNRRRCLVEHCLRHWTCSRFWGWPVCMDRLYELNNKISTVQHNKNIRSIKKSCIEWRDETKGFWLEIKLVIRLIFIILFKNPKQTPRVVRVCTFHGFHSTFRHAYSISA